MVSVTSDLHKSIYTDFLVLSLKPDQAGEPVSPSGPGFPDNPFSPFFPGSPGEVLVSPGEPFSPETDGRTERETGP